MPSARVGRRPSVPEALLSSLRRDDTAASEAAVAAYLEEKSIELIGTRTLADITDHLISIAEDREEKPLDAAAVDLIERYVGVSGPATTAGEKISSTHQKRSDMAPAPRLKPMIAAWRCLPTPVSILIA